MDALGILNAFVANSGSNVVIIPCHFYKNDKAVKFTKSWTKYVTITFIQNAPFNVFAFNAHLGKPNIPSMASDDSIFFYQLNTSNTTMTTNGTGEYSVQWSGGTTLDLYCRDVNENTSSFPLEFSICAYCIL